MPFSEERPDDGGKVEQIAKEVKARLEEITKQTYSEYVVLKYRSRVSSGTGTTYAVKVKIGYGAYDNCHLLIFNPMPDYDHHNAFLLGLQENKALDSELDPDL